MWVVDYLAMGVVAISLVAVGVIIGLDLSKRL